TGERGLALLPPVIEGEGFLTTLLRAPNSTARQGHVQALNAQGAVLGCAEFKFASGEAEAKAQLELPLDLRNNVSRIEIAGETSAGSVSLLDERWRRRTVGLVSGSANEEGQQLLSDLYYLQRAIAPYAALRQSTDERGNKTEIADLLSEPL